MATKLVDVSGGNLLALAILAWIVMYIMGMGVSTLIIYILMAIMVAPAIMNFGVPPMAANLFIFYASLTMFISPPLAPVTFVASAISGAPAFRIGYQAMKLGAVVFLIPLAILYHPALVLIGGPAEIGIAIVAACFAVVALSSSFEGYLMGRLNWIQRILLALAGAALFAPQLFIVIIGAGVVILIVLWHWVWHKAFSRGDIQSLWILNMNRYHRFM